jgi:hypothetical protein
VPSSDNREIPPQMAFFFFSFFLQLAFVWLVNSFPSSSFLFVATISAVLLGVVLLIVLCFRYAFTCVLKNGTSFFELSRYDCRLPVKEHVIIATLDQCCTLLAVAGGPGTSGQAQIALNQSMIPLTLLLSSLFLKRRFNVGYDKK